MDDPELRITKLELKSGDLFVAKFDGTLTQEAAEKIRNVLMEKTPEGINVLVIDKGCDLTIITAVEIQRRAKLANAA